MADKYVVKFRIAVETHCRSHWEKPNSGLKEMTKEPQVTSLLSYACLVN